MADGTNGPTAPGRTRPGSEQVPGFAAQRERPSPVPDADDPLRAVLDATRALLWIKTPSEAATVARDLVERLGGSVVPAGTAGVETLPVDVCFGVDGPSLPAAEKSSLASMLLERHLPVFVRDVNRALELADQTSRFAEDAAVDALTGLPNRRVLNRALGRLRPDDTVVMIDLDHFKSINDTRGHEEGDKVLRLFGHTLASTVRAADRAGRYGGEEFVVIVSGPEPGPFLDRLRAEWARVRPYEVTFSAGAAGGSEPRRALQAADRAMYRAKRSGRDQWQWATEEDFL
jgi:diguanylate cyclase (GGDEF)-like protein